MVLLLLHCKNDYANDLPMLLSLCAIINICAYKNEIGEFLDVFFSPPFFWRCGSRAMKRFLNHTQRRITVGRAPPDEWSARRRDLYLSTYNTHKRQTSLPLAGIEPLISTGKWPQTHGLRPRGHWDRLLELITNCKPRIAVDYFNVNSNFMVITP